jgi:hypothetical protein
MHNTDPGPAFTFNATPDPDSECEPMRIHAELTRLLTDFAVTLDDEFLHILRKYLALKLNKVSTKAFLKLGIRFI